jgi:hypothetical protein
VVVSTSLTNRSRLANNINLEGWRTVREVVRATTFTVYVDTNKQTVRETCHTINELMIVLGELQDQGLVDKPAVSTKRFLGRCQEEYAER